MNISATSSPFLSLSVVLRAVMAAVAGWGGRGVLGSALTVLLYGRLAGICGRMERLAARFEAGVVWRRGPSVAGADVAVKRRPAVRVLPGRFGWLVRMAGYQAAGYGSQLRTVLETPEMVALLAASPQAARMLRPVCRMLAVETRVLRPRTAGVAVVPDPVVAPVVRRAGRTRDPVDWGRIALPRGVLAAARRGFKPSG